MDAKVVHQSLLETIWPDVADALLAADTKLCDEPTLSALISPSLIKSNPSKCDNPPWLQRPQNARIRIPIPGSSRRPSTPRSRSRSVRTVPSLAATIAHINDHGSHPSSPNRPHSPSFSTTFVRAVDSAGAFVNASLHPRRRFSLWFRRRGGGQHWTDPRARARWTGGTRKVQVCSDEPGRGGSPRQGDWKRTNPSR